MKIAYTHTTQKSHDAAVSPQARFVQLLALDWAGVMQSPFIHLNPSLKFLLQAMRVVCPWGWRHLCVGSELEDGHVHGTVHLGLQTRDRLRKTQ